MKKKVENNNNNNTLNLKTLYDVRLAKERFRYQLLQNQLNLKEEINYFRKSVREFSYNPLKSYGFELLSIALGKLLRRKGK